MKLARAAFPVACLALFMCTTAALAISPRALENAYWRFEEGPADAQLAWGDDTVPDSSGDENHSHSHGGDEDPGLIVFHPLYSSEVPTNRMLRSGLSNTLSFRFDTWMYGTVLQGKDIWTNAKDINNPVFTDITIEAAFKADAIAPDGRYQAIIVKNGQPTDAGEPPLVLKIRGDNSKLQIEAIDKGLQRQDVQSIEPLVPGQWYYAAVVGTADSLSLYLDSGDDRGYVLQGTTAVTGGAPMVQYELGAPEDTGWDEQQQKFTAWKLDTSWAVGRGCWNNANADWFAGWIDEVRISNRARTPDEFLWIPTAPPNPADFDQNDKVNSDDLIILNSCATGPEIKYDPQALPSGCSPPVHDGKIMPDIDKDGDVDQDDFGLWQRWYTG